MNPTLLPQDLVLVSTKYKSFCAGDIVVFNSKTAGLIVKRITQFNSGVVRIRGDNPRLDSSVCNQDLDSKRILGKVIGKWRNPYRKKAGESKTLLKT